MEASLSVSSADVGILDEQVRMYPFSGYLVTYQWRP